jgi:hypothetical protein
MKRFTAGGVFNGRELAALEHSVSQRYLTDVPSLSQHRTLSRTISKFDGLEPDVQARVTIGGAWAGG